MSNEVPILVMAFSRPGHLQILLDRLRDVEPQSVYFAVDGARAEKLHEDERVAQCRQMIEDIDWIPRKFTLFQDANLGCGRGVTTAITWFFDNEEAGIVLEDDIVPEPSFFPYCAELLDRYRDDQRVFAISGCNFVPLEHQSNPDLPYRFSQIPHIWGWATWRDRWSHHRLDISGWQRQLPPWQLWQRTGRSISGATYWASTFELLARGEVDTWDGQLVLAAMTKGQLTATSNVNLVQNIGFDDLATHTVQDRDELPNTQTIQLPLSEVAVELDVHADAWTRRHHFRATPSGMMGQASRYLKQRLQSSE